MAARVTASIITIGNELLSGDTVNTNASWLAQQLEELGVTVTLMASLPDEIERIAAFVRTEPERADVVLVTGGLGGTPDDVTLEAMGDRYPGVLVGSYPKFHPDGATVEVVVKSSDPAALEAAVRWIEEALEEATS